MFYLIKSGLSKPLDFMVCNVFDKSPRPATWTTWDAISSGDGGIGQLAAEGGVRSTIEDDMLM